MTAPTLIKLSDVKFAYPGEPWLLKGIELSVKQGEFVGVVGGTGSGKSSLLYVMCGVVPHLIKGQVDGVVELLGQDVRTLSLGKITQHIGMVAEDPENQLFNLIVKDEVAWALENRGVDPSEMDERVDAVLDFMQIGHLKDRVTYNLSGGEKQRLALAATYVAQPDILLLDSPVSMLDPMGSEMFVKSFRDVLSRGQTVVMVTDKLDELVQYADRIIVLHEGHIALDCAAYELGEHVDVLTTAGIRPPQVTSFWQQVQSELGNGVDRSVSVAGSGSAGCSMLKPYIDSSHLSAGRQRGNSAGRPDFVQVEKLSFTYPRPNEVEAVKEVSLGVARGSFVAMIGQNGSGKTTLSRCMSGLLKPTEGRTLIGGQDVRRLGIRRRVEVIGYVFQNPDHQIFLNSVQDDVEFGPRNLGWPAERARGRAEEILKTLKLWGKRDVHPYRLSKGERQCLAIASVAAMQPEVLVVDEPTTGQDPQTGRRVMGFLDHLREEFGMTIIVVTHAIDLVAEYCNRALVLSEGKLLLAGPTRDVLSQPEILQQTRVQPPPITRLTLSMGCDPAPLTVGEAIQSIDMDALKRDLEEATSI